MTRITLSGVPVLPADVVPGALFGFSLRKIRAGYTGPCVRVRNSLGATTDIGFTSAGDFDATAYTAFVNQGDGTGHVVVWYDQSIKPINLTQPVAARQPTIVLNARNGHPAIKFVASINQNLDGKQFGGFFGSAIQQPSTATVACVGSFDGGQTDGRTSVLFSGSNGSGGNMQVSKRSANVWGMLEGFTTVSSVEPDSTATSLFIAVFNGATTNGSSLRINGGLVFYGTLAAATWQLLRVGADQVPNYSDCTLHELIGYPSVIPENSISSLKGAVAPYWQVPAVTQMEYGLITAGTPNDDAMASVLKLADGTCVLAYTHAPNAPSSLTLGSTLMIRFSADNGKTWTAENTRLDGTAVTGFPMAPTGSTGNEGTGEPFLYLAPNGDLLVHTWQTDFGTTNHGSWQARSTDGGKTWGAMSKIMFANLPGGYTNDWIFSTDDYFVVGSTIYAGARILQIDDSGVSSVQKSLFISSPDNGVTWNYVSDVSRFTSAPLGTVEQAFAYLGGSTILAIVRGEIGDSKGYKTISTDMGATWNGGTSALPGALTDITAQALHTGRPRIKSFARLLGQASWWTDPKLVMSGFSGGDSARRPCIWVSYDSGANWSHPIWLDTIGNQAYGDMFFDPTTNELVVVTGGFSGSNHAIAQYRMRLVGLSA